MTTCRSPVARVYVSARPLIAKEEGLYGQGIVLEALPKGEVVRFQNRIGTRMSVEDHQFDGVRHVTAHHSAAHCCRLLLLVMLLFVEANVVWATWAWQVFGPSATQADIFEAAVLPVVADVCAGLNAAVFAYGATDTGTLFTLQHTVCVGNVTVCCSGNVTVCCSDAGCGPV